MGVLCDAAENRGLLKKKKRTAVKLKAVSTDVDLPKKYSSKA